MPRSLRRTAAAEEDLVRIWLHIAEDDPGAADRFLKRLDERCLLLLETPKSGQMRPEIREGMRHLSVGRDLVLYREFPDGIEIVRVVHGSRDLSALFD